MGSSGATQLALVGRWEIGTKLPGAPLLRLDLGMLSTPPTSVTGHARLSQAISPPLDVVDQVSGSFHTVVTHGGTLVVVSLTGYPVVHWPPHGGIGPVIPSNLDVRLVLGSDWRDGTASYRYTTEVGGQWHEVTDAPATWLGLPDAVG
ncbi:hypothetical protein BJP25_19630 [Actinokineospora bangkokensis]|uniref:DUF1842 domain-containing protein n=1 Tax=Actinokineospora bangkokensis TaxID=1193682 RepID=A0A1Q9LLI4_9PSEU|nr:hypothetical protein BJP25_19630 [Actinokineospora bangkokensis]